MSTIDNFKSRLSGGGARPNLFRVMANFPPNSGLSATGLQQLGTFMIKGASLPASIINPIEVPYRGRKLKVAGDRTFEPWTITVINDNNMDLRNAFETWMDLINGNVRNTSNYSGDQSLSYYANMIVEQLDRKGLPVKQYTLHDAFPTNVAAIELNFETNDTIEEFTVELNYQYWTSREAGITRNNSGGNA